MNIRKPLVIWGSSGHALTIADVVDQQGLYEIVGFLDDLNSQRKGLKFAGYKILGGAEQLESLRKKDVRHIVIGIGDIQARVRLAQLAEDRGFLLATIVHPSAVIAPSSRIGAGTAIMAGAVINPDSVIGANTIINTTATVDHESKIGDGAHICPGVCLGGNVSVGHHTWVGIGSTVKDNISIGPDSMIGAGSVVLNDIPEGVMAYGVPAKVIGPNPADRGHND